MHLEHHGISGQKWGQRNGPPYPLSSSDYSSAEKRLNKISKETGKIDRKVIKNEKKIAKLQKKADKFDAKSSKHMAKSTRLIRTSISDWHGEKAGYYKSKSLWKQNKIEKIELKNAKLSEKSQALAKELINLNKDLKLSDLASSGEKGYARANSKVDSKKYSSEFKRLVEANVKALAKSDGGFKDIMKSLSDDAGVNLGMKAGDTFPLTESERWDIATQVLKEKGY